MLAQGKLEWEEMLVLEVDTDRQPGEGNPNGLVIDWLDGNARKGHVISNNEGGGGQEEGAGAAGAPLNARRHVM